LIRAKDKKEAEKWAKKLARARRIEANKRAKELHAAGVDARRIERRRKAALKKVAVDDIGAAHLAILIPDPEQEAKLEQERLEQEQEAIPETILEGFEAGDPAQWYPEPIDPSREWL
jgi:hypothetical protein